MKNKASIAVLAAGLFCLCSISTGRTGRFSVLTYNVAGLPEPLSGSRPIRNQPLISPLLNDYDLVLVQEDFAYHGKLSSKALHPHASKSDKDSTVGDGLSRFSVFPFDEVTHVNWVKCAGYLTRASDCMTKKGFSLGRHRMAGGVEIDVYNLHMEAGGSREDTEAKQADMDQLMEYVLSHSEGRALIIAGDFNLKKKREKDRAMLERMESRLELTDACLAMGDCQDRIDRIYLRSGGGVSLRAVDYDVPDEKFQDEKGRPLSDHLPVSAVIEWKQTAK